MIKKLLLIFILVLAGLAGFYYWFPGTILNLLATAERSGAGLEPHSITTDDLQFSYLSGGSGDAIVLLHGFGANKDNWTRFAAHLTPHYRVIIPDLNGFGESSAAPDSDYRIGRQAERLRQFTQALQLQDFHLGGSSMGGYIAGVYAAGYPEQINSLLLVAPSGVATAEISETDQLIAAGKPDPTKVTKAEDYDRLLEYVFTKPPYIPAPLKAFLVEEALSYSELHANISAQLIADKQLPDMEALLTPFTAPTLILWGEQDRVLHVSGGTALQQAITGSELEIMENTGHLPMIEQPQITAQRYLRFLQKADH
ncbi:MAG: alpha/beta fold hydrolase [Thiolinea sp.]